MALERCNTQKDVTPNHEHLTNVPGVRPETSKDVQAPSTQAKEELNDLKESIWNARKLKEIQVLKESLHQIVRREENAIKNHENHKKMGGWLGSFNRWWIGSDPYAIDISNSQQIVRYAKDAEQHLASARQEKDHVKCIDLLNIVRRTIGVQELREDWSTIDKPIVSSGLNIVDNDATRYEAEQQGISASRDTIETGLDIASLGGGLLAKKALKEGAKRTFRNSAIAGAGEAFIANEVLQQMTHPKMDERRGDAKSKERKRP